VTVTEAVSQDVPTYLDAIGKTVAREVVSIQPQVSGRITKIHFTDGANVKKGDLLVQIRPDNYLAIKNSAEATHMSALAGKQQAQEELGKAEADYVRNEALFKSKLIAENIFADFKTALAVARLRLQSSEHQANQARFALDQAAALGRGQVRIG